MVDGDVMRWGEWRTRHPEAACRADPQPSWPCFAGKD